MNSLVSRAPVFYIPGFLTKDASDELQKELNDIDITRHTYKDRNLARKTAVFGDDVSKIPPGIWGDDVGILEWTPMMAKVLDKIQRKLKGDFNICLVNKYDSGKDFIGWHSDNEEKGDTYCIASLSLGVERNFSFLYRSKELGGEEERVTVKLEHGSMLLMHHPCQDKYLHSLPKMNSVKDQRINLTYRKFHYDKEIIKDNMSM
jgi:hypothetical protein